MQREPANEIINNELCNNINTRLQSGQVEFLIKKIIKYFPSEIEIIWKGAYDGKSHRESSIGRGLLLQKYYSIHRKLKKCGALRKESLTHNAEDFAVNSDIDLDEDITLDNIQWLKNNSKPWNKVQELWRLIHKSRLRTLQKEITAIHDYMDLFPALKCANGYLLLEQDFEEMYLNSVMKLYSEMPLLAAFIEKKLNNKKEIENINDSCTSCKYTTLLFH